MEIGFIGQGYIGKNYADDFEDRGFKVVRYSLEPGYVENREKIQNCDIVFIAVPTPTTPKGFDSSVVAGVLPLVGAGKIAVIKSTLLPGTTRALQADFPDIILLHSPEFLSRATAVEDTKRPRRNIIGTGLDTDTHKKAAEVVLGILPSAPFSLITTSNESEFIKYANNTFFYMKTVFMNTLYDMAISQGCEWKNIKTAMQSEPWIGSSHLDPVHQSGRGAGGPCLIKDFKAFLEKYRTDVHDPLGLALLEAIAQKNLELLTETKKDLDEVYATYGDAFRSHGLDIRRPLVS